MTSQDSLIVITGMTGAGKTSAGRLVAAKLGREFLDTDTVIESREGAPVPTIYSARVKHTFANWR